MRHPKNLIKTCVLTIADRFPKRYILFESVPDRADNAKAVFDELARRGYDRKYRFVWWVSDQSRYPKGNVRYVDRSHRLSLLWYHINAKALICCNQFLPSLSKKQTSFYLTHGTAVKRLSGYYRLPDGIDYAVAASEASRDMMARELGADVRKFHALGFPRNDALGKTVDLHRYFAAAFQRAIVWYPTFRRHKTGFTAGSGDDLPLLHTAADAETLNQTLAQTETLLIVKPHFAQDVSRLRPAALSHIVFINDDFLTERKIGSYELLAGSDALITDYSSVYFDYLLRDKPIAAVWADLEAYRANPGFAIEPTRYLSGAVRVDKLADLTAFIRDVAAGRDDKRAARAENNAWANRPGESTPRVADFIVEKANL